MTILTPLPHNDSSSTQSRNRLLSIFSAIGKCRVLDEKHFDAATALAGSGPAFVCVFLEAMVDGAVMMGLPRTEAVELAAQSESFDSQTRKWMFCSHQIPLS
jgi:pyrroline-5-carboxylate reductase